MNDSSPAPLRGRHIQLRGIVQGVGMRPTVYRHAACARVRGWVLNGVGGVSIQAFGTAQELDHFEQLLHEGMPAQAVIESYLSEELSSIPDTLPATFSITPSDSQDGSEVFVAADLASCDACVAELFDPGNRRYRYPFINCTDCGPRFTVIADLPYDRPKTSMASFPMCKECSHEYHDPINRRFDAQPDACFMCGPQISWIDDKGRITVHAQTLEERRKQSDEILKACCQALEEGLIVALKGLGGFHLACDASNQEAVERLRRKKRRPAKAFAIMAPSLECIRNFANPTPAEISWLSGSIRPIVLLEKTGNNLLAPAVCNELPEVGVMLPYTPLHHLLLHDFGRPLVMTSGNISGEPICTDEEEALARLGNIADAFLMHDRKILTRYDDSVIRLIDEELQIIRRARGLAPRALKLPESLLAQAKKQGISLKDCFALGPEQKHCFCMTRKPYAFVSQHLGDLENQKTLQAFFETEALYKRLFRIHPQALSCDMHPEYLSHKYALKLHKETGLSLEEVQHHHAHAVACSAEHNYADKVGALIFDGTGYARDGAQIKLWGGEIFEADWNDFNHLAQLESLSLPGGARAIKETWRIAYAYLVEHELLEHPGAQGFLQQLQSKTCTVVQKMLQAQLNCPRSSSAGRWFDMVSALLGIALNSSYEGEAAILLEAAARKLKCDEQLHALNQNELLRYKMEYPKPPMSNHGEQPPVIGMKSLVTAILDDCARALSPQFIAYRFHYAFAQHIADIAADLAHKRNLTHLVCSGGCFMNKILFQQVRKRLQQNGLTVLMPHELPPNDGGIAYGQAVCCLSRQLMEYNKSKEGYRGGEYVPGNSGSNNKKI